MTTITQAIASLERQLNELTYDDGTKVFKRVYIYAIRPIDMESPCATILAETTMRARVTAYTYILDQEQVEKCILPVAEACSKQWDVPGHFGWLLHTTGAYRTFSFVLTTSQAAQANADLAQTKAQQAPQDEKNQSDDKKKQANDEKLSSGKQQESTRETLKALIQQAEDGSEAKALLGFLLRTHDRQYPSLAAARDTWEEIVLSRLEHLSSDESERDRA